MDKTIYKELDSVVEGIKRLLEDYTKSKILQEFFSDQLNTFLFANLINNFFINLTKENVKEHGLPKGYIGKIKHKYKGIHNDVRQALRLPFSKKERIDENYYSRFKAKIEKEFPAFSKLILEIEKLVNIKKAKDYLKKKRTEIKKAGKYNQELHTFFMTTALEVYVQKQGSFPDIKNLNKIMKVIVSDCLPEFSEGVVKTLEKTRQEMLEEQGEYRSGFEKRLYKRWKMPLDLLECLIRISLESIEQHAINLGKTTDKTNNYKREAFIRIHARALQICNEILVLLKSGYPDGANSRWRTLHELAVISLFLTDNNNDVSRRYLEHDAVKRFKEAVDYKSCYRKLGYPPFGRKEFNKVKKEYDSVIAKHGNDFRGDYGWIPRTVLADRNFMGLENHVKLGKLRPFYNLSCNAVHGGARGFYRLGLMDQYQDKIVAVGPSNYGLADPLQNAAISLLHISNCVLAEEPDFESVIEMQIMDYFVNEIGIKAVEVQKQIEREETTASR